MKSQNLQPALEVMLAVDGSEHSQAAIALLRDLPLPAGTAIVAVGVLIPREAGLKFPALSSFLEHTGALLQEIGLNAATELLTGYPSEQLTEYAERHRPDLIVLGAKGLRATMGILLGGVAQQVVEYAACPVLIVRAPYTGLKRVLLTTDGSPPSQQAADYLSRLGLPRGAEAQVIYVVPPAPTLERMARAWPADAGPWPPHLTAEIEEDLAKQTAEEERQGQAIMAGSVDRLKAAGLEATGVLARGDAATEIIEYVKQHKFDLIVAGARGHSQRSGWFLGSVARKLVHYAGCSVLIVKGSNPAGERS